MKQPISNLQVKYYTLTNYSPKGPSPESQISKKNCINLKSGKEVTVNRFISTLKSEHENGMFNDIFGADVVLVPAPSSSVYKDGNFWLPKLLCDKIVLAGLAESYRPFLKRISPVAKSAYAEPGKRPSVADHLNTIVVDNPEIFFPPRITIVDDLLTLGSTTMACYLKLYEAFPFPDISIFCFARTQSLTTNIVKFRDPSEGILTYDGEKVNRHP